IEGGYDSQGGSDGEEDEAEGEDEDEEVHHDRHDKDPDDGLPDNHQDNQEEEDLRMAEMRREREEDRKKRDKRHAELKGADRPSTNHQGGRGNEGQGSGKGSSGGKKTGRRSLSPEEEESDQNSSGNRKTGGGGSRREGAQAENVLEKHRRLNRATRPPNPDQLALHARRQEGRGDVEDQDADDDDDDGDDDDDDDHDDEGQKTRKTRTAKEKTSTTEGFYSAPWKKVVGRMKTRTFSDLLMDEFFPGREEFDLRAKKKYVAIIQQCERERDLYLEDEYKVWNNTSTFRGRCKTAAQKAIDVHFRKALVLSDDEFGGGGYGQAEYEQKVADNVAKLISGGSFAKNGKDQMGKDNNFMAPVIGECLYNILYRGKKDPAAALRKRIKRYEPEIIAAAVTSIRGALDDYTTGTFLPPEFTEPRYRPLYDRTLMLINQALEHEDHGPKMRAQWGEWMKQHSCRGAKKNPGVATAQDMDITL
ncbi:hypothetical protein B0H16DRAFT_1477383, partial [Mycena metata]